MLTNCLEMHVLGRNWWSVNKLARSVTKWTQGGDRHLARLISCIHHTNDHRQCCYVGNTAQHLLIRVYFKTRTLLEFLKIRNQHQVEFCAFLVLARLCPSVGCATNILQYDTVLQNLTFYRWMLVCAWTVYSLLISGTL